MTDPRFNPQIGDRVRVVGGPLAGHVGTVVETLQDVPGIHDLTAMVERDGVERLQGIEFIHLAPETPTEP
jgi:ribosomal protein L24